MGVTIVDTQDTAKIKKMKNFHPTGNCPIRDILCRLGDKWSMLVLITLNVNGTMRFSDIQKTISDISQRMLTVTLRTLEADGLVSRTVYAAPRRIPTYGNRKNTHTSYREPCRLGIGAYDRYFRQPGKGRTTMRIVKIFYTEVFYDIFLSLSLRHKLKNNHLGKK